MSEGRSQGSASAKSAGASHPNPRAEGLNQVHAICQSGWAGPSRARTASAWRASPTDAACSQRSGRVGSRAAGPEATGPVPQAAALGESGPDLRVGPGRERRQPDPQAEQRAVPEAGHRPPYLPVFALYTESRIGRQMAGGHAPTSIPPSM